MDKPFKTATEQIEILKKRGICIKDDSEAASFLIRRNYYSMINGYGRFFQSSTDVYLPDTTLSEIEKVYIFDESLKSILYSHIMETEKYLKATLAYYFCMEHPNPNEYTSASSYHWKSQREFEDIMRLINNLQSVITDYSTKKSANAIKYYMNTYGFVPLWVLIQYMYLRDVINMFSHCSPSTQNNIAKEFSSFLQLNTGERQAKVHSEDLLKVYRHIKTIRNAVAHDNNIFFYKDRFTLPYIAEIHNPKGIKPNQERNDIYQTFLIMQCLISPSEYSQLEQSLINCLNEFRRNIRIIDPETVITALGFPSNWGKN